MQIILTLSKCCMCTWKELCYFGEKCFRNVNEVKLIDNAQVFFIITNFLATWYSSTTHSCCAHNFYFFFFLHLILDSSYCSVLKFTRFFLLLPHLISIYSHPFYFLISNIIIIICMFLICIFVSSMFLFNTSNVSFWFLNGILLQIIIFVSFSISSIYLFNFWPFW